ncbi:hypothetical protein HY627_00090 [Candidatus Uhrbacteria bacterium]|nr:hypothetical protein [Candidatus Uhrbacteria bacterium]
MEDNELITTEFDEPELRQILDMAGSFLERGSVGETPQFALVLGGVGTGKTTFRRQRFAEGYVHFDYGDVFTFVKHTIAVDNPKFVGTVSLVCQIILGTALDEKKNIVIELIGDTNSALKPILDSMVERGYKISASGIECEPMEAYRRHLLAVKKDRDYLSSYYTQEGSLSILYDVLELGPVPQIAEGTQTGEKE